MVKSIDVPLGIPYNDNLLSLLFHEEFVFVSLFGPHVSLPLPDVQVI